MPDDPVDAIVENMFAEHRKVLNSDALVGAVVLTYVFIDSVTKAGLDSDRDVTGKDFIDWVDRYMTTAEPYEYTYSGRDVYLARCSMLHTLSTQTRDASAKQFFYHDGFPHRYRSDIDASLVGISVPLLVDDFYMAVARFRKDVLGRADAKAVEGRFVTMYRMVPFKGQRGASE